MPFLGDQPYWARRIHDIGAGPAPVGYLQRLRDLMAWEALAPLVTEDGVTVAVAAIEEFAKG